MKRDVEGVDSVEVRNSQSQVTNKEMYEDPLMTKPKQIKIPKLKTRQPINLTNASQMLKSVMAGIAVKTKTIDVYPHT